MPHHSPAIIESGEQRRFKNLPRVCEIEAMLTDVGLVLFIVPLKPHRIRVIARSLSNKHDSEGEAGIHALVVKQNRYDSQFSVKGSRSLIGLIRRSVAWIASGWCSETQNLAVSPTRIARGEPGEMLLLPSALM